MKFLPSDEDVVPDVEASSGHAEIKCPSSAKKTSARLRHAKAQLDVMGSGEKTTYLGLQNINDVDRAWAIAADVQSEGGRSSIIVSIVSPIKLHRRPFIYVHMLSIELLRSELLFVISSFLRVHRNTHEESQSMVRGGLSIKTRCLSRSNE